MSVLGILDAMRSHRPLAERLVWMCLENHANGARFWAMTITAISAEIHLAIDTVSRSIGELERAGIIRCVRRKRHATIYHMVRNYPNGAAAAHVDPAGSESNPSQLTPQDRNQKAVDPAGSESDWVGEPADTPQEQNQTVRVDPAGSESLNPPVKNPPEDSPPPPKRGAVNEVEGWDEFWDEYPRKVGKAEAFREYQKALKITGDADDILDALIEAKEEDHRFTNHDPAKGEDYRPHPRTWLHNGPWKAPGWVSGLEKLRQARARFEREAAHAN